MLFAYKVSHPIFYYLCFENKINFLEPYQVSNAGNKK